jgi:hypothetical protein
MMKAVTSVLSLKFLMENAKGQMQIPFGKLRAGFRLTTPKLKSVWGPFRSG